MRGGPDPGLFDLWSRFYDVPLVQRLTYRPEQDAVLRGLRPARLERILDLGCGTGLLAARIHAELPARRVTGCDFSPGMLHQASQRTPALPWVQGDALRLPFRDGAFDAAVSTEAFHWFPDQPAALGELHRVLAPGGRLLLTLGAAPEWLGRLTTAGSRLVGQPLRWPTRDVLRRMVEDAGFRVEAQRFIFRLPAPLVVPAYLTQALRP